MDRSRRVLTEDPRERARALLSGTADARAAVSKRLSDRIATYSRDIQRMEDFLDRLKSGEDVVDEAHRALDPKRGYDDRLDRIEQQAAGAAEAAKCVAAGLEGLEQRIVEHLVHILPVVVTSQNGDDESHKVMAPIATSGQSLFGDPVRIGEKDRRRVDAVFGKSHPRFREASDKARAWVVASGRPKKPGQIVDYLTGEGGIPEFQPPAKSVGNRLIAMGFARVRPKKGSGVYWWPIYENGRLPSEFQMG